MSDVKGSAAGEGKTKAQPTPAAALTSLLGAYDSDSD